jgi:tetratricopeptide (TPR) repeat protein
VLGLEHRLTLTIASNMALVLRDLGKYEEAEKMNRRALVGFKTTLGSEHHLTVISKYCLAFLLENLERYDEALLLYSEASDGYKNILGLDHPSTRACLEHHKALAEKMKVRSV